jgi:hypothetical protein
MQYLHKNSFRLFLVIPYMKEAPHQGKWVEPCNDSLHEISGRRLGFRDYRSAAAGVKHIQIVHIM